MEMIIPQLLRAVSEEVIMPSFGKVNSDRKYDGSIVTEVDIAVQDIIQDSLFEHYPEISFLGEEMSADDQEVLLKESDTCFWCLDPLDGTTNFVNGVPFFAVSLALIESGKVTKGWILDPVRNELFHAVRGIGSFLDGRKLQVDNQKDWDVKDCIAIIDFKRLKKDQRERVIQQMPYRSQRNFGACALEWCWMAAGRAQVYVHGGQKLWDIAAGSLLFEEAGGIIDQTRPIRYDKVRSQSILATVSDSLNAAWRDILNN